jgi:hypothetical protein
VVGVELGQVFADCESVKMMLGTSAIPFKKPPTIPPRTAINKVFRGLPKLLIS